MQYVQNRTVKFTRKVLCWCVPLVICIATAMPAHAQTLHAVLIILDADQDIGSAMQVNAERMQHFLREVEKKDIGLQVETTVLLSSRNEARKGDLTTWLDTREIADEDVLLVYFSGKGRFAAPAEHLYLQDGGITHTELSKKVQSTGTGRLTLLITDRCDAVLKKPFTDIIINAPLRPVQLEALFMKHKGFLHLTSATEQEPGWANAKIGGLFTYALTGVIEEPKHQGITSWEKVFKDSREIVEAIFLRETLNLPESFRETLRVDGIRSQTPKAYQLPTPSETPAPADTDELWALENPHAAFTVDLKTDKKTYVIDESIILSVEVTDDTHVFIFNWKNASNFSYLFPNKFENDNFLASGRMSIPPRRADYEIIAEAPGTERFKILALRNVADSDAIQQMLIAAQSERMQQRDRPQDPKRQPKHTDQRVEEQIGQYLREMKPTDWAEDRTTAEAKTHSPPEEDDFRKPDDDSGAHKDRPSDEDDLRDPDDVGKVDSNLHPNPVNIVFFKVEEYGSHAYLAQLTNPDKQDTAEIEVHIFNAALREKHGETLPKAWIIRERTEPKEGWGHRSLMLGFYRDEEWIFTTGAVMHEDHYLLPEQLNGNGPPIQGDREVGFGDVRIPIPVAFQRDNPDTEK